VQSKKRAIRIDISCKGGYEVVGGKDADKLGGGVHVRKKIFAGGRIGGFKRSQLMEEKIKKRVQKKENEISPILPAYVGGGVGRD